MTACGKGRLEGGATRAPGPRKGNGRPGLQGRTRRPQVEGGGWSAANRPQNLLAVADFGDEVGEAIFDFGAGERLGALAGHRVAAGSSLKLCFVNVAGDRIAHRFGGEGQCSAPKLFRPGVYGLRLRRFHAVPDSRSEKNSQTPAFSRMSHAVVEY